VLAVATTLLLVGLLVLPACGSDAEAATFQREPVDASTPDPFMDGIGTDQTGVVAPANVKARAYSAKIPGLYGGSGDNAVCDPAALASFLATDDAKASAWAKVLGISVAEIPTYIATLTPVLLRTDTAVTNHGFKNGAATSIPAVLQAGTAVLVDDHGVPVVKCGCGNPLTAAPSTDGASFTGTTWKNFEADTVTTVEPTPEPVAALVIANPGGTGVVRPIGTIGDRDTPFDPATMTGADDPTATTPDDPALAAADDPATAADDDPAVEAPRSADGGAADDGSGPSADSPTDDASNAENPDGATPSDTKPTGSSTQSYTFSGTTTPGAECGVPTAPVDVQVTGSGSARRITLPSASGPGFAGLVFAVNPDGSIDADTTWEPPGAPGLVVTYRFQGQLTINDPPTPSTVTGTLTVSGSGIPDCAVQYDTSGQTEPTPTSSDPAPEPNPVTTYVATYGMANSADAPGSGVVTNGCARARFLDRPFSITIRVREGVDGGEVRVLGLGINDGDIAPGSALPLRDLRGGISDGAFRVGGSRTYDATLYEGDYTAHWSGRVGARRTRPAEFPLTINQTWVRDRDVINWLRGSGGPEDYSCTFEVRAVRQA
jgi:hypothetical protein